MNKAILRLAIPNILSNISIPLLSAVDVSLMGGLSIIHLGAIGLATMIFNFFFWNFGFLRMGTTGLVAQAYGANDTDQVNSILSKAIYLALSISFIIIVFQYPIGYAAQYFLGFTEQHQPLVWDYFLIRIWAAPASLLTYCFFGFLFGKQNALFPLIVTIVVNSLNIMISYYLVVVLKMGIEGVAIGTVCAEYFGILLLTIGIHRKYRIQLRPLSKLRDWSHFLNVNKDLFIRTVALTSAFAFFYRESSLSGNLILAANVVILQFLSWMSYGIDGFAFASESLVGLHFGEKNRKKLRKVIQLSFIWGFGIAIFFSVTFGFFSSEISRIFTSDTNVITLLNSYRWWLIVLPIIAFSSYMWDGIFIGLTRSSEMRNSMLISLVIYIIIYLLFKSSMNNAIWMSFVSFLGIRGILLTYYYMSDKALNLH